MIKEHFLLFIFTKILLISIINAAAAHKHAQHTSKERLEDGAYAPRDVHHHEGGEHRSEFDHEAIIGSVKEAEEFDNLSPEESQKRLAILVEKMDMNKDLFIDRHELKAWILRSFKKLSDEEASDRFDDIDQNEDRIITWQEYIQDVYGFEDEHGQKNLIQDDNNTQSEENKLMEDDKVMFNAADLNNDGVLNPEEYVLFQNPEEHPQMLPVILEQTLKDKDENKDGKIDFTEFIGSDAKEHDKEWLITEKEKFDKEFDKNHDGVLSGNEILSWVVPSDDEIATDEVEHLFASADDDHDDRLSYEEIIKNYEIFVGSEATDYGDHLKNIHHFDDEL